jgi:hypothetical protein
MKHEIEFDEPDQRKDYRYFKGSGDGKDQNRYWRWQHANFRNDWGATNEMNLMVGDEIIAIIEATSIMLGK